MILSSFSPLAPVIGLAEGETRWRGMPEGKNPVNFARLGKSVGFPKSSLAAGKPTGKVSQIISEIQKFRLPTDPNHFYIPHRPDPQRGVSRSSRTLGRGCGGRCSVRHAKAGRRMMLMRTAKSCGSDAPMLALSLR